MTGLFSQDWINRFQSEWNKDTQFNALTDSTVQRLTIGYGFPEEITPRACIVVDQGQITQAGLYDGQPLDWDLRAREPHWKDWFKREIGASSIGLAYTTGKLKILAGDYWQIIKNPTIKQSLIKGFSIMGRL